MSNFNDKKELYIYEDMKQYYVYKAKIYLRSFMDKDSVSESLAELMLEEIKDTTDEEDVPSDDIIEQEINKIIPLIVEQAITECQEEEKSWAVTDCDKLSEAFSELSNHGIVAKENFTCCQSCGSYEIFEYAQQGDYGYVFYHEQDTERAVEGQGIYLAYGHIGVAKKSLSEITEQIVQTIEKHGLKVDWNGSSKTRMLVNMDWKKRISVV